MMGKQSATIVKCKKADAETLNKVTIKVNRAAVKMQVQYGPGEDGNGVKVRPTLNADFSDCRFAFAQSAIQMYMLRNDDQFTPTSKKAGASTYDGLVALPAQANLTDDFFTQAVSAYSPDYADNVYGGETVTETPTTGNAPYALIRLVCKPKKVYGNKTLSNGTFWVLARNEAKTATWIYASDKDYNLLYFASKADAEKYCNDNKLNQGVAADKKYAAYEFTKGQCYYRVNIVHNADAEVLSQKFCAERNNYYRINVTDIKALGSPTGAGVLPSDPDTPIELDSWMVCEILVAAWLPHENNTSLQ